MNKRIMRNVFASFALSILLLGCSGVNQKQKLSEDEIIYHLFQRSFYDSNNDSIGDLKGIVSKLDYLQNLGVTSILLTPLYESVYYHNYYSSDFEKIDPQYGTLEDYFLLVRQLHKRGMKLYMDMETQYVTQDHAWYKDSYGNPDSPYSDYILYDDSLNLKPSSIVFDLYDLKGFDGQRRKITTVNLLNKNVRKYNKDLFAYWLDPNKDGNFEDGVDGFRLDHMMDDLDNKGILTNLFQNFWVPLIDTLKSINPKIKIMAEQADWGSYGFEYLTKAQVDWVFGFAIQRAIRKMDSKQIMAYADTTFNGTPEGKNQILFIENHDMVRFSTAVNQDKGKLLAGASLNLLIGGIPSIYYGQEIGMLGDSFFGKYGGITDANEIPYREAFEWERDRNSPGMAFWYADSGPWWLTSTVKSNDGISVAEQKDNPNSLLNAYKALIQLRGKYPLLIKGKYRSVPNTGKNVVSFVRYTGNESMLVLVNLSQQTDTFEMPIAPGANPKLVFGENKGALADEKQAIEIAAYATQVWSLN